MLILAMSFSGSVIFLAILLSAVLGKRLVSSAWVYNMLKIGLISFCFPLPIYNSEYKYILFNLLGITRHWNTIDFASENIMWIEESGKLYLNLQTYLIVIWVVWACGLLFVFIRNMHKYNKVNVQKANPRINQPNYLAIFDRVKKELGIKKCVALLCANDAGTVCTIGIFRKYIIVPERGMTDEEIYYSLKHELIHAKRSDGAWRYMGLLAVLIHWFNPLAYLYLYVMSIYCERSCDAILVQNLDKTARKKYGELIISMSRDDKVRKWKYQTYLSGSKKIIEWRLTSMLKVKNRTKIKKVGSLLLSVIILLGSSLTVCAYESPQVIIDANQSLMEASKNKQHNLHFVNSEELQFSEEAVLDFMKFLGDDGTYYDLSEMQNNNIERTGCIHSYVSGYVTDHHKKPDGSCQTDYYYADRCSKCGEVRVKGYSHTETSTKCTH